MPKVIHHYAADDEAHEVPRGSRVIAAVNRGGKVTVYVEKPVPAGPDVEMTTLVATFVGTGTEFPDQCGDYVGSVIQGVFIWHVYARID
jgi:hypothetical protein